LLGGRTVGFVLAAGLLSGLLAEHAADRRQGILSLLSGGDTRNTERSGQGRCNKTTSHLARHDETLGKEVNVSVDV
jgi:hypothetical protein